MCPIRAGIVMGSANVGDVDDKVKNPSKGDDVFLKPHPSNCFIFARTKGSVWHYFLYTLGD